MSLSLRAALLSAALICSPVFAADVPSHAASAAAALPAYLTGTWGTAKSLYVGTTGQSELHLEEDGIGIMAGSSKPLGRVDCSEEARCLPRAIIGAPVAATVDGDIVSLRPFMTGDDQAEQAAGQTLSCRYELTGPTLICTSVDGVPIVMKRRSETVPAEAAKIIASIRSQASAATPK